MIQQDASKFARVGIALLIQTACKTGKFLWHSKKIYQIKIKDLIFYEDNLWIRKKEIVDTISQLELESLTIKLNQFNLFDKILVNQKQLKKLEIQMPINNSELQLLTQLPQLEELHLRVLKKTEENLKLGQFQNLSAISLQWQGMKPQEVLKMVQNSYETLKELEIDSEEFNHDEMLQILNCLNKDKIEKLYIQYFYDFSDLHILKLSEFYKLKKLSIFRAQNIEENSMLQLFQGKQFQKINLNQCDGVTDRVLFQIIKNCQQLKYINLSWSIDIYNHWVSVLFEEALQLEEVYLIGCKQLTDECIPKNLYSGLFKKLRHLSFESCNAVSDEKLMMLKSIFRYVKIVGYYGVEIDTI
ncbi:unnamed protein product (macronuclear) [Paramecium tetraurelia]|uniref:Uncharacterized protein n=1 Tax=Paramecium tetraurelia TaxID=5888 RepID=A0EGC9_PARTE|nr:uncharacterized protein GSPATT00026694001 [Paramecium tetraurelia]CAK94370.1 unnamed protein product [Paramecium tetraurelia]|eukprot:XP_001461743.1 hypothetical protein (macronuclear) [Paramecium tetraurelia strain d4-2]